MKCQHPWWFRLKLLGLPASANPVIEAFTVQPLDRYQEWHLVRQRPPNDRRTKSAMRLAHGGPLVGLLGDDHCLERGRLAQP